jgi:hypothetical protein
MPFLACSSCPSLVTVVTMTRLPQTMGQDQPRPGISVLQTMFSVTLQRSGSPVAADIPAEPGPRNWGQFSWASAATDPRSVIRQISIGRLRTAITLRQGTLSHFTSHDHATAHDFVGTLSSAFLIHCSGLSRWFKGRHWHDDAQTSWRVVRLTASPAYDVKIYQDLGRPENAALVVHEGGHEVLLPALLSMFE